MGEVKSSPFLVYNKKIIILNKYIMVEFIIVFMLKYGFNYETANTLQHFTSYYLE